MTRKDYVAIAEAIEEGLKVNGLGGGWSEAKGAILTVAKEIANVLAADNKRFDRERFLKACGF